MKKYLLMVLFILFVCVSSAFAFEVKLGWDANTESDLAGYKLYYGTQSGVYDTPIDLGLISPVNGECLYTTTLNLQTGTTYYFALTAYDNETPSLESGKSNEIFTDGLQNFAPGNPKQFNFKGIIHTSD